MEIEHEIFTVEHGLETLTVETMLLPKQVLFKVTFPDNSLPLVLCRALNIQQKKFWTSVPEGRQKLAEKIGPLIEIYYRSKYK